MCAVRRAGNADDRGRVVKPGPLDSNGQPWQIGTRATVDWITEGVMVDGTVAGAVPPRFEAYAAFEEPDCSPDEPHSNHDFEHRERQIVEHERAVVSHLRRYSPTQWWLGYLDTGAHDVVFPAAERVSMYFQWNYVLVQAGPEAALAWRPSLPDLIFPLDRSWLLSMLWDDADSCVGDPTGLIDDLIYDPKVNARRLSTNEPLHPPGYLR